MLICRRTLPCDAARGYSGKFTSPIVSLSLSIAACSRPPQLSGTELAKDAAPDFTLSGFLYEEGTLDPDRLLHVFRIGAGIPSTAKPYGGWMAPGHNSRGEFVGHYLSACAQLYASTGDAEIKEKALRVVAGLARCQERFGNTKGCP